MKWLKSIQRQLWLFFGGWHVELSADIENLQWGVSECNRRFGRLELLVTDLQADHHRLELLVKDKLSAINYDQTHAVHETFKDGVSEDELRGIQRQIRALQDQIND